MNNSSIPEVGGRSAKFALILLVIVYVFNFIDRQILTILAEDLKADLNISDSDIGFLYGTAFAVFYSVVGIPMGKLADTWNRKNLISLGLAFWSLMTFLSGTAKSFLSLSIYRSVLVLENPVRHQRLTRFCQTISLQKLEQQYYRYTQADST